MLLWNVRDLGLTGAKVEKILERVYIFANKNSIQGDKSPMNPGAVRIGTPAITSRGFKEEDVKILVGFFERVVNIAKAIQDE
jgi:glycine hydroxymethyltransferase